MPAGRQSPARAPGRPLPHRSRCRRTDRRGRGSQAQRSGSRRRHPRPRAPRQRRARRQPPRRRQPSPTTRRATPGSAPSESGRERSRALRAQRRLPGTHLHAGRRDPRAGAGLARAGPSRTLSPRDSRATLSPARGHRRAPGSSPVPDVAPGVQGFPGGVSCSASSFSSAAAPGAPRERARREALSTTAAARSSGPSAARAT